MPGRKVGICLTAIFIAVLVNKFTNAQFEGCCPSILGKCRDGTSGTPCCGMRACNFWCCSCGACWGARGRRKRDFSTPDEPSGFRQIDKDGNGQVDKDEAHLHLLSGGCGNYSEKIISFEQNFKKFDTNGDGKLSFEEINGLG